MIITCARADSGATRIIRDRIEGAEREMTMGRGKGRGREDGTRVRASIMSCKYSSSLGPPGMECINPLMHMGPVKLDSDRFSWKCDISVSTKFSQQRNETAGKRNTGSVTRSGSCNATWRETLLLVSRINDDILHPRSRWRCS